MNNTIGIYVHIPFCRNKCPYCDFNSIAVNSAPDDIYIDAALKELSGHIKERPSLLNKALDTIYIGGGTPSLVEPHNIKRLIGGIRQVFSGAAPDEITIEINPGTATWDRLAVFKDAGINRLSIGIQSFNEKMLKTLGRIHSAEDSVRCYEYARKAGFNNIGIDLIFGAPEQSIKELEDDMETAACLRPEHISTYNLTIENGTSFFTLQKSCELALPSEEEQTLMYEIAIHILKDRGYNHYEISNFSLAGFESQHNNRYWLGMDYLGLGAGAHSYISSPDRYIRGQALDRASKGQTTDWGTRWWNEKNPYAYMQLIKDTDHAIAGKETLKRQEALEEGIFLGLRRLTGIDTSWFSTRFNISLKDLCASKISALKAAGLLYEDANSIRLTHKGLLLSNEVFAELI
ncbi:MAG: radical SAM family heme chaperone HemW [Deltaproteobacteria bacterium]|nr:radical SAM family heme chaperone HemW [Deltaproteobacteria bacterium]